MKVELVKLGIMRYFRIVLLKKYEMGWLWIAGKLPVRFVRGATDRHGIFVAMKGGGESGGQKDILRSVVFRNWERR